MATAPAETKIAGPDTPVGRLLKRSAVFVRSELTLRQAAEVLDGDLIGTVLVRVRGQAAGIVSERDVVRALAEGADPDEETVLEVMSDDLVTVNEETPLHSVADLMLANQIRHAPVTDRSGAVLGVVSARDVLGVLLQPSSR